MNTVYFLRSADERTGLLKLIRTGKEGARVIGRARILVKLDDGRNLAETAHDVLVSGRTVRRIRDRYLTGNLNLALYDLPRTGQPCKHTSFCSLAVNRPKDGSAGRSRLYKRK